MGLSLPNMKKFFERVWGGDSGWVYVGFKNHTTGDWVQRIYRYPHQLDEIVSEIEAKNIIHSAYFCPHTFREKGRRIKSNSSDTKFLWLDKDAGSLVDFDPKPTICWQTSEGKWQGLWELDQKIDITAAELINKNLIETCKGDPGGWHAGKYLRVPGTINHKYSPAYHGLTLWDDGQTFKAEDFVPMLVEDTDPDIEAAKELTEIPKLPNNIPTMEQAFIAYGRRIPRVAWELLQAEPKKTDDWSYNIWRLESLLVKADIPLEHVFALVKGSPWNKYARDGRPDNHLWKEIYKAHKEKAIITPEDELEDLPWVGLDNLLLYAERPEWLVEDIWMEKNVGWIAGEGKSYKSVMSLDLALSVASGSPFLGRFPVKDPGPVLMVQEEDPVWRVAHRIQAMALSKDITNIDVAHRDGSLVLRMSDTNVPLFLSIGGQLTFEDEKRMDALERAIAARKPKLLVMDPMFMLSAGMDEFKAGEMANVLNTLKYWRNEYECAIAIVHHFRKGHGADTQKLYGSMALYAWSENSLLVQRESRDSNLVSIRRDIKDAPSDKKISVDFINIDDEYRFDLVDASKIENNQVADALRSVGEAITIKGLEEMTGLSDRTIRRQIKDLELGGFVDSYRTGRGGILTLQASDKLLGTSGGEEVVFG